MSGVTMTIFTDKWDCEMRPTAVKAIPPRVFAQEILGETDWDLLCEREMPDEDPLVVMGTASWLRCAKLRRDENTILAWLVARMRRVSMCYADGHDDDGIHWFDDCWADDDESPHEWETWWALDADPIEFLTFAQQVARR